ncbi:MAG: efflux RND transporter periplasmic adaptor subunit [Bacteroidota bacterium]
MKPRQFIIISVGLLVLVGAFAIYQILSGMEEPPKVEEAVEIKKYVKTAPVQYRSIPTSVVAYGRVETAESLDMIAEVSGRMTAGTVILKEGQRFRKGALIYKIDDTEVRLNLQSDKSNFLKDLAAILPDIKIDFAKNYQVWSSYLAAIDLNKALPELPKHTSDKEKTFLATRNIFGSYYSIKSKEANLRKYKFYAPFDGSISQINLQSGSFVNPGSNIGRVLRSNKLELRVDVGTSDIDWVEMGAEASVTSERDKVLKGKVTRIGDYINPQTQSIDVFITLEPSENRIYDGEYLKANIPGRIVQHGMIIPRNAIFNTNEVFVLEDSLLKVRQITLHKLNPETAIFSGLAPSAALVVEPLINAHNNMKAFKLEEGKDIDIEQKESSDTQLVAN